MSVLSVAHLVKRYNQFLAVDDISFELPKGTVMGLLGSNGAGKSTTIQMLLGLTIPTSGRIEYFGKEFEKHRGAILQRVNYASAFNEQLGRVTVWENLFVFAQLYGIAHAKNTIQNLLDYFQLNDIKNTLYQHLSTGQKTRCNFVKALLNDPEVILMDEPTASLDPDVADKTLTLIEQLQAERNLSIIFTSHNMEEVTRICDEVIIMHHGKIVAQDTPLALTKRIPGAQLFLLIDGEQNVVDEYIKTLDIQTKWIHEHQIMINTDEKMIPKIIFGLSKVGVWITDIEVKKPTLEDFFLHISRGTL